MEQHRTRPAPHPQRPPAQRRRPGAAVPPPAVQGRGRPALAAARRLPRARLTGLGGGLFACAAMVLLAGVDWLLFGASLFVYGLLFLPVAAATALWVRPADLITAPVTAPIAFAVGVWPISGGSGGIGGQLMGLVSALSLHAGWLYAGTLVAALVVVVRKAVLISRRRLPRKDA
ncbi:DUF6542 domain-containing protein [Streptomyces subrutilus]|uniref:DUF6542 domain-containing protein n=1 Tax=Streptomyces subrutilus TaxID=36818 RepID=UPI00399079A6